MGNIVLLDDLTINKIAAGEVIERPASVVKEMLENSIDAGAKNITVEIKNGGISLIQVTDDGCGIAEDDMEIAFERHATSKIRNAEDLSIIKTMGFRGEALASIASIAKVEMISKRKEDDVAHKIIVEGGKTVEFTEAARSVGTTITVHNLFYNTPVRYKFLKKDYTETGYIEDTVTRIALVNTNVAIKLISNGKTIVQTNGHGDLKTAIYSIYGKDTATEVIDVDYDFEGIKVTGIIGKPVIARGNRANQLFFLNGRYIKDKNLSAAADQAYKGMIPVGRYGFIVLNLEMDPKLVDVNVHPAKLEVRFEDESTVFKAVYHAIKSNLAKSELVANVEKTFESSDLINSVNTKNNNDNRTKLEEPEEPDVLSENVGKLVNDRFMEKYEKKNGLTDFFKKIMKGPEETQEELNNNTLEEIFKYRNGLKKEEKNEEKVENKDEENSFNPTSVSSETKKIDVENVNKLIKDSTKDIETTKKLETENTQEIEIKEIKDEKIEETQIMDVSAIKQQPTQDTIIAEKEEINNLPQNTINLETKVNEEIKNENVEQEKPGAKEPSDDSSNDEFSKIAQKLFEEKINIDSTQSIDTSKVREAIKESEGTVNPEFNQMYKKTFGVDSADARREKELEEELQEEENKKIDASTEFSYATAENMNVFEEEKEEINKIPYKFIGIVFSTYIIIEIKNEMYVIDQHAAHERIMYEKIKHNYYSEDEKDEQLLLLPDVISLTHKEWSIAKENVEMFAKAGFTFEEFGENTIKLVSVPSMCEELNTKQLFLDILDELDTVAVTARQEKEDKFIATVACKSAVKAKMKLDEQEVTTLIDRLLELPNPFTCPHGRPTAIKMTKYDLEKKFSRR